MPTEEERALLHRQQIRNRERYRRFRNRQLTGDPQRRKALGAAWEAVVKRTRQL